MKSNLELYNIYTPYNSYFLKMSSEKIAIFCILAGLSTAMVSSTIDSFFSMFISKKQAISIKEIIKKCLLSACTGGIIVSIVFYYFFSSNLMPIRMLVTYSIIIGIAVPSLSNLLIFTFSKLFYRE